MPPPFEVTLVAHDVRWISMAREAARDLDRTLGALIAEIHHVGSTAVPGLVAKPVIDLMPVVSDLGALDRRQSALESLGYVWWGEYGLAGRRYLTKSDADTGRRLVQLHCYAVGDPETRRHLAFRDHLRAHPEVVAEYAREKLRCQAEHGGDSHAYGACKSAWIDRIERDALVGRGD